MAKPAKKKSAEANGNGNGAQHVVAEAVENIVAQAV